MQDFVIAGAVAAGSRFHLAGPPYYEQFQGRYNDRNIHNQCDSSPIAGREVVRDAHGRLIVGYDVSEKVPQRRGHGPRTHSLQRQVHELALGSLVDHGAQRKLVRRRA